MARSRSALVTASDSSHFPLLMGLLSTLGTATRSRHDVFVLDGGMTSDQVDFLERNGVQAVEIDWSIPLNTTKLWLRTLVARPFLPDYIPGYDVYIWLDADTWLQRESAVQDIYDAAEHLGFAAVSSVHRGYSQYVSSSPKESGIPIHLYYQWLYKTLLGNIEAGYLSRYSFLNGGVWAASSKYKMFQKWQEIAVATYKRAEESRSVEFSRKHYETNSLWTGGDDLLLFQSDEVSMNAAARIGVVKPAVMDARYNWICSLAIPMMSTDGIFIDTAWPHDPLYIIHQVGTTKVGNWPVSLLNGAKRDMSLRAPQDNIHSFEKVR